MKYIKGNLKKILLLLIVVVCYLVYTQLVIKPHRFNHFSLIDDSIVLLETSSFYKECISGGQCADFFQQVFEAGSRRFRPTYWLINTFLIEVLGRSAPLHHLFRVYVVGLMCVVLLALVIMELGGGYLAVLLAEFIFITNFSFSENIIRLGTNEPYQVLFLALFSLLYLSSSRTSSKSRLSASRKLILISLLTWALLIKESSFAIIPTVLAVELYANLKSLRKASYSLVLIPTIILITGVFISKNYSPNLIASFPDYTANYQLNFLFLLKNGMAYIRLVLNSTAPFVKAGILVSLVLLINGDYRKKIMNKNFMFWIFFSVFFVLILLPWRYVLERYLLMAIFGISIVSALLFEYLWKYIFGTLLSKRSLFTRGSLALLSIILITNIFFRGFPINLAKTVNYGNWFATFTRFEAEQVVAIGAYAEESVYLNGTEELNNLEVLYGIPLQLKHLYDIDSDVQRLQGILPDEGLIFSRSSFEPEIAMEVLDNDFEIVESKSYFVEQIDPLSFRESFKIRPIQTIEHPPLKEEGLKYYWEIRKL